MFESMIFRLFSSPFGGRWITVVFWRVKKILMCHIPSPSRKLPVLCIACKFAETRPCICNCLNSEETSSWDLRGENSVCPLWKFNASPLKNDGCKMMVKWWMIWVIPSMKLTVRPWKWMVGIRSFPIGFLRPIFRGVNWLVSGRVTARLWKMMVVKWISIWQGLFSGAMLNFRSVSLPV